MTPEREEEIRALAARFTAPGSKHPRIGAILDELLGELDEARQWEQKYWDLLESVGGVSPG